MTNSACMEFNSSVKTEQSPCVAACRVEWHHSLTRLPCITVHTAQTLDRRSHRRKKTAGFLIITNFAQIIYDSEIKNSFTHVHYREITEAICRPKEETPAAFDDDDEI